MSIQPMDLQTLFVKMSQVGKEQAVEKDSITLQQQIHGNEIEKRNQHNDNSVNRADNSDTGAEKTKEDNEHTMHNHEKRENEKNKNSKPFKNKEVLFDPDLGKNIDFSG